MIHPYQTPQPTGLNFPVSFEQALCFLNITKRVQNLVQFNIFESGVTISFTPNRKSEHKPAGTLKPIHPELLHLRSVKLS